MVSVPSHPRREREVQGHTSATPGTEIREFGVAFFAVDAATSKRYSSDLEKTTSLWEGLNDTPRIV